MKKTDKLRNSIGRGFDSAASLLKVALMSKRPSAACPRKEKTLIVMGNGPSLRGAIDNHGDVLARHDLMSVNFAPLTPEFFALRPAYHILADGLFFETVKKGNVEQMWEALRRVDWPMTLYVPAQRRGCGEIKSLPSGVIIKYFNLTPAEGWSWLSRRLYDAGLAMPRPRNVLVPAVMSAIREGFGRIVLVGADHSWSKTLWVTDENRVVSVQPHFYKDNEKERERVESLYKDIRLHQIYESFAIAFRSYFQIAAYAEARGVRILNATPGSFIDAFPRIGLEDL